MRDPIRFYGNLNLYLRAATFGDLMGPAYDATRSTAYRIAPGATVVRYQSSTHIWILSFILLTGL